MLVGFPHKHECLREEQDLQAVDTWSNSQLKALVEAHNSLLTDYKCSEWPALADGNNNAPASDPQASSLVFGAFAFLPPSLGPPRLPVEALCESGVLVSLTGYPRGGPGAPGLGAVHRPTVCISRGL